MPSNKSPVLINNATLQMYMASQSGINPNYSTNNYFGQCNAAVEESSASLLQDYVSGAVIFDKDAEDTLNSFLILLKKSRHPEVKAILPLAYTRFKISIIAKRKEEEKRKNLLTTKFKILENKKQTLKLSSDDLMMINELMAGVTDYSTSKLKNKLMSLISLKIDRTLKGEMLADKNFGKLVSSFGSYQQSKRFKEFSAPKKRDTNKDVNAFRMRDRRFKFDGSWLKKAWRNTKRAAVVAGIAILGCIGIKSEHGGTKNETKQNPVEMNSALQTMSAASQNNVKTFDFHKAFLANNIKPKTKQEINKPETTKKSDVSNKEVAPKSVSAQDKTISIEEAYKASYEASVKLHLGEKKSQNLYKALHQLEKAGKIEFDKGTNLDWYAYSYTMYKVIAPYSKETRLFEDFLKGKPVDKSAINDLVIKAGRNGCGVKGSGSYSAYDNASQQTQKDYIAKRNAVKQAKKAFKNLHSLKTAANGR